MYNLIWFEWLKTQKHDNLAIVATVYTKSFTKKPAKNSS